MKKTNILKAVLAFVLCLSMALPFVPVTAEAETVNNFNFSCFADKKVSIIGDSISTFQGVSNDTSYHSSIGSNAVYYGNTSSENYSQYAHIRWEDTWWQQVIDVLDMELCVNNSWSGSRVLGSENSAGWKDQRTGALSNAKGEKPDVIFLYMGTNDCNLLEDTTTVGTHSGATAMTAASTPVKILDAYSVMIQKVKKNYPDAEIYCFTLLPHKSNQNPKNSGAIEAFNQGVTQLAATYGCFVVDLYQLCGISHHRISLDATMLDNLHPDTAGMDAITNCVISSMLQNSRYADPLGDTYSVTYNLPDSFVEVGNVVDGETFFGDVTTVVSNQPFSAKLDTVGISNLDVTVTMGGVDITNRAVRGNSISIPEVTGNLVISAANAPRNYYITRGAAAYSSNEMQSAAYSHNGVALVSGTHTNGVFSSTADGVYRFSQSIVLRHDRPWVMELKMGGSTYAGGVLALSDTKASSVVGNTYLHANQSQFLLGFCGRSEYHNSGISWTTIATKLGRTTGANVRNELLTFKLENRVAADGTNMPHLYVNGIYIGPMNSAKTHDWVELSGMDFVFNYMGSTTHPLQNTAIEYVKIYENGMGGVPEDEVHNFRWAGLGDQMTSAATDGYFTENAMELEMGTGANGSHVGNAYYSLNKPINLYHDRRWTLEFRVRGDWGAGSSGDPMLLSSCDDSGRYGITYLWRNSQNFIGFGCMIDGESGYQNYGVDMNGLNLSAKEYYTYRLTNRIQEDGSNMVYLYIDDVEIGPMNRHRDGNTDTNPVSYSNWVSGKDFRFNFLGNKNFPLSGVTFDYIQVWENGSGVDTVRLEYLINTARSDSGSFDNDQGYTDASWNAYVSALNNGIALLSSLEINQAKVDLAVDAIMSARNALTTAAVESVIYSAESVTGGKAAVGMQTAVRVVTSPDIVQLCVGKEQPVIYSSEVQTMEVTDESTGKQELRQVKVWFYSWQYSGGTAEAVTYGIGAYKTYDAAHTGEQSSKPDAYTTVTIAFSSDYEVA